MKSVPRFMHTHTLVEAALMIAAAQLLSYIKLFEAPFGGSVTAASMLPIVLFAIRRGPVWGFGAGFAYGLLQQFLGGAFYNIPSLFLDYLVAFCVLGVAGFFGKRKYGLIWGGIAAGFARFLVHFAAGILVWADYAPDGMAVWQYSLGYNGWYMLIDTVIVVVVSFAIFKAKGDLARRITYTA